ncbi:MAG: hypothetical protein M3132_02785 [Actinomycetia bacterium]|nr:hypothetical protein [Actinomycetes bacterium]
MLHPWSTGTAQIDFRRRLAAVERDQKVWMAHHGLLDDTGLRIIDP